MLKSKTTVLLSILVRISEIQYSVVTVQYLLDEFRVRGNLRKTLEMLSFGGVWSQDFDFKLVLSLTSTEY